MKTRLPWIMPFIWAAVALSPPGRELFHSAFLAGEGLERAIWQPIYLTGAGAALMTVCLEVFIRHVKSRRGVSPKSSVD